MGIDTVCVGYIDFAFWCSFTGLFRSYASNTNFDHNLRSLHPIRLMRVFGQLTAWHNADLTKPSQPGHDCTRCIVSKVLHSLIQ